MLTTVSSLRTVACSEPHPKRSRTILQPTKPKSAKAGFTQINALTTLSLVGAPEKIGKLKEKRGSERIVGNPELNGSFPSRSLGGGSASGAVVPTSEKKVGHSLLALLVSLDVTEKGLSSPTGCLPRTDTFTDPAQPPDPVESSRNNYLA